MNMKYKLIFNTSPVSGAGTDAGIYIKIYGSKLTTQSLKLKTKLKQFEKRSTDIFFIESEDLGNILKIQIWHDDKLFGADWNLEDLVIEEAFHKKIWYFPIFNWIKKDQKFTAKSSRHSFYNIEIITGTLPGSGTNDDVLISLIGSKTYTSFISLNKLVDNKIFKTGHSEIIKFLAEDVGKIEEINVKTINPSLNSNWFLNKIRVKKNNNDDFTNFLFFKWIKPGEVYKSQKNLSEYTIKFFTGDVAAGGTDANVSMIITGSKRKTYPIRLNSLISRNAFESGNTDYIKLAHEDLGKIKKVKIWHDEKWLGDGWYLNKILIRDEKRNDETLFPYYSWLDKAADPKSVNIELTAQSILPRPFYAIAHMVNTPSYVEEALDLGSNAIEFDITPRLAKNDEFKYDVFHGFRPDFDPDKINLMERSLARTGLPLFLERLTELESRFEDFSLAVYDCKLSGIPKNKLESCGEEIANIMLKHFYKNNYSNRIFKIISIPKKKFSPFFDGIIKTLPVKLLKQIGFDFSMESFQTTENYFSKRSGTNFWWGGGIASTVPKPLKHFIPQFLIAAKKRTNRGIIKKIYYWTLDDPDSMTRILVTKLDGIIVNDPLKLLKVLQQEEFKYSYRLATREDDPFKIF